MFLAKLYAVRRQIVRGFNMIASYLSMASLAPLVSLVVTAIAGTSLLQLHASRRGAQPARRLQPVRVQARGQRQPSAWRA